MVSNIMKYPARGPENYNTHRKGHNHKAQLTLTPKGKMTKWNSTVSITDTPSTTKFCNRRTAPEQPTNKPLGA